MYTVNKHFAKLRCVNFKSIIQLLSFSHSTYSLLLPSWLGFYLTCPGQSTITLENLMWSVLRFTSHSAPDFSLSKQIRTTFYKSTAVIGLPEGFHCSSGRLDCRTRSTAYVGPPDLVSCSHWTAGPGPLLMQWRIQDFTKGGSIPITRAERARKIWGHAHFRAF